MEEGVRSQKISRGVDVKRVAVAQLSKPVHLHRSDTLLWLRSDS